MGITHIFPELRRQSIRKATLLRQYSCRKHIYIVNRFYYYKKSLQEEDRVQVEEVSSMLLNGMGDGLGAPPLDIKILKDGPFDESEELHGLYEPVEVNRNAQITVWMRTAKQKRVVAFRSFLRTLLHEFCHHLDYELFMLQESFHTGGFFKRESSLFKQLMGEGGN